MGKKKKNTQTPQQSTPSNSARENVQALTSMSLASAESKCLMTNAEKTGNSNTQTSDFPSDVLKNTAETTNAPNIPHEGSAASSILQLECDMMSSSQASIIPNMSAQQNTVCPHRDINGTSTEKYYNTVLEQTVALEKVTLEPKQSVTEFSHLTSASGGAIAIVGQTQQTHTSSGIQNRGNETSPTKQTVKQTSKNTVNKIYTNNIKPKFPVLNTLGSKDIAQNIEKVSADSGNSAITHPLLDNIPSLPTVVSSQPIINMSSKKNTISIKNSENTKSLKFENSNENLLFPKKETIINVSEKSSAESKSDNILKEKKTEILTRLETEKLQEMVRVKKENYSSSTKMNEENPIAMEIPTEVSIEQETKDGSSISQLNIAFTPDNDPSYNNDQNKKSESSTSRMTENSVSVSERKFQENTCFLHSHTEIRSLIEKNTLSRDTPENEAQCITTFTKIPSDSRVFKENPLLQVKAQYSVSDKQAISPNILIDNEQGSTASQINEKTTGIINKISILRDAASSCFETDNIKEETLSRIKEDTSTNISHPSIQRNFPIVSEVKNDISVTMKSGSNQEKIFTDIVSSVQDTSSRKNKLKLSDVNENVNNYQYATGNIKNEGTYDNHSAISTDDNLPELFDIAVTETVQNKPFPSQSNPLDREVKSASKIREEAALLKTKIKTSNNSKHQIKESTTDSPCTERKGLKRTESNQEFEVERYTNMPMQKKDHLQNISEIDVLPTVMAEENIFNQCNHIATQSEKSSKTKKRKKYKQKESIEVSIQEMKETPLHEEKLLESTTAEDKWDCITKERTLENLVNYQSNVFNDIKPCKPSPLLDFVQDVIGIIGKKKACFSHAVEDAPKYLDNKAQITLKETQKVAYEAPLDNIPAALEQNSNTYTEIKPVVNNDDVGFIEKTSRKSRKRGRREPEMKSVVSQDKSNERKSTELSLNVDNLQNTFSEENEKVTSNSHNNNSNNNCKEDYVLEKTHTSAANEINTNSINLKQSNKKSMKSKQKMEKMKITEADDKQNSNKSSEQNVGRSKTKQPSQLNEIIPELSDILIASNKTEVTRKSNLDTAQFGLLGSTEKIRESSLNLKNKSRRRNRAKKTLPIENKNDEVGGMPIAAPLFHCGGKSESDSKKLSNVHSTEKCNKNHAPEKPLTSSAVKKEPPESKIRDLKQQCRRVTDTLSEEQLTHITTTAANLRQSLGNSERSQMTFTPDVMRSILAPKPTNILSSADDEEEFEYQIVQRQIFLPYVCHVCKSFESSNCNLKKCNNCKMISYCSKKHQKDHWVTHRDFCKTISKICASDNMSHLFQKAVGLSPDKYRYYRNHYVNECSKILGRELELWEKEMIYYPQVCQTCYESDAQKLTTCENCHHVSYCQPQHLKTDHNIWCKEFQVYRDIIIYQFHHGMLQQVLPEKLLQQHIPLTGDMETFMINSKLFPEKSLQCNRMSFVTLTEIATCPLSILFSLQNAKFQFDNVESLTVHLVGAEMHFEVNEIKKWEMLLLHSVPCLKLLKIVFAGPELKISSILFQTLSQNNVCSACNTAGRRIVYEFWPGLYHEFLNSEKYEKPDLICAFNSGMYRSSDFQGKDTWSPSIKVMLKDPSIPLVITEYTDRELPFDLERIQNIVGSIEIILPPIKNPFSSSKPSLNFLSEEMVPVIFKNFYITVIKGSKT